MADHLFPRTATVRSLAAPSAKCSHAQLLTTLRAGLLALGSVVAVAAFSARASAATVATDQPDYHPGQTVTITSSGWKPGETVDMVLHEDPPLDPDLELTSVADASGDFTNTDFTVDVFDIGVTFTLTATGLSSGQTAETTFTDAPGTCGNGTVETGEDCDLGSALNGAAGSCCKNNCTFASSTNTCRAAAGECDLPETCTGSSATCPADGPRKASGTACTDDGNACTLDQCNGTSDDCQHPAGNAGAVCRAAAGECDVAENCTGSSTTWPSDVFKSNGTACTDDGNPCTADVCSGTSTTCTHPAGNAGAACPDDGDPCTADTCDGTNTSCQHLPGNGGTVCRPAAGECDVAETCPGAFIIGFRGSATNSSGTASSATSLSISRPAGTLANDVMVASISAHGSSSPPTITPPSGWTLIVTTTSNGQNLAVSTYWKLAGTAGADPGPYSFTVSPSSRIAGGISAYFNVDTTNPINASGGAAGSSTPSITTTVANTMLVGCFGRSDNKAVGAPSGMTERFNAESSSSGGTTTDASSESADALQASPGASGSKASTSGAPNTSTAQVSQLIALAPPSSACPPDAFQPNGTGCTDDGNPCTTDTCSAGACSHPAGNAGTECRASAGPCDVAETCTGSSAACPADGFQSSSTVCRASAGPCDVAENCTGSSAACPADGFQSSSTVCRASAGPCDVAESCTGSSAACPADGFQSSSTVCRASAGPCDVAENCTGSSAACPADGFQSSSTICRASAGPCDVAENCTGSSAACPADAFQSSSTVCRASAGECDPQENCTGTGPNCPANSFASSSTVCRASAGPCDVAENCTGTSAPCPADAISSSSPGRP